MHLPLVQNGHSRKRSGNLRKGLAIAALLTAGAAGAEHTEVIELELDADGLDTLERGDIHVEDGSGSMLLPD